MLTALLWSLDLNCERTSSVLHAWCRELCEHTTPESVCKCRNSVNFPPQQLSVDVKRDQILASLCSPLANPSGSMLVCSKGADNPARQDVGNREFSFLSALTHTEA